MDDHAKSVLILWGPLQKVDSIAIISHIIINSSNECSLNCTITLADVVLKHTKILEIFQKNA